MWGCARLCLCIYMCVFTRVSAAVKGKRTHLYTPNWLNNLCSNLVPLYSSFLWVKPVITEWVKTSYLEFSSGFFWSKEEFKIVWDTPFSHTVSLLVAWLTSAWKHRLVKSQQNIQILLLISFTAHVFFLKNSPFILLFTSSFPPPPPLLYWSG